ncbi:hypothetical protein L6164_009322 [Bauhinia variegata]|uniref:Uncharacterized protein n=1 Tax=Bauhinia variegata TaxID=167791 RepID=A0ACB9PKP0_BAUVA|nr:hypothetical protein L6164_009322 [Bauhinia variegata]
MAMPWGMTLWMAKMRSPIWRYWSLPCRLIEFVKFNIWRSPDLWRPGERRNLISGVLESFWAEQNNQRKGHCTVQWLTVSS